MNLEEEAANKINMFDSIEDLYLFYLSICFISLLGLFLRDFYVVFGRGPWQVVFSDKSID